MIQRVWRRVEGGWCRGQGGRGSRGLHVVPVVMLVVTEEVVAWWGVVIVISQPDKVPSTIDASTPN